MSLNRSTLLFLLLIPLNFWAQNDMDSVIYYKSKLQDCPETEIKLEYLSKISKFYNKQTGFLDSLNKYSKTLLKEAIAQENLKYEIKGLIDQGRYNSSISNNDFALRDLLKALRKNKDKENIDLCNIYNQLGIIWFEKGNFSKALQYFLSFESSAKNLKYKKGIIQAYLNIGWTYTRVNKNEKGENFFKKGLELAKEVNDSTELISAYNALGTLYLQQEKEELANEYFEKGIDLTEKTRDISSMANAYTNKAIRLFTIGKLDSAKYYFDKALQVRLKTNIPKKISESYFNMGEFYFYQDKLKESLPYYFKSKQIGEEYGILEEIKTAYDKISSIYNTLNMTDSAYFYVRKFHQIKDSLSTAKNQSRISNLEFKYELDKTKKEKIAAEAIAEKERELAAQESKSKLTIIVSSCIVGVILISLLIFLFRDVSIKNKLNRILSSQKEELQTKNDVINTKNEEITSSMEYARNIQSIMLPDLSEVKSLVQDISIIYKPKDIISGDFYWASVLDEDTFIFATIDCTGHGIPGAMLTVMADTYLNEIVNINKTHEPSAILQDLNKLVILGLSSADANKTNAKDGMDMSIIKYTKSTKQLEISSANSDVYLFQNKELTPFKTSKSSIGGLLEMEKNFLTKTVNVDAATCLFLATDGYKDQFGGEKNKKFGSKRLKQLFISSSNMNAEMRTKKFNDTFEDWGKNIEQIDDVCLISIRFD